MLVFHRHSDSLFYILFYEWDMWHEIKVISWRSWVYYISTRKTCPSSKKRCKISHLQMSTPANNFLPFYIFNKIQVTSRALNKFLFSGHSRIIYHYINNSLKILKVLFPSLWYFPVDNIFHLKVFSICKYFPFGNICN